MRYDIFSSFDLPMARTDLPSRSTQSRFRGIASFGEEENPVVLLEVADTPSLKTRGLMGRNSLPDYCGMLFVDLSGGSFWMKGCKIPLDIVFLDKDGIVSRTYSMPADGGSCKYPYVEETAIELPYGFCRRHKIRIGTPCSWRRW